jgi:flagellar motor switch protein FliN/FliY
MDNPPDNSPAIQGETPESPVVSEAPAAAEAAEGEPLTVRGVEFPALEPGRPKSPSGALNRFYDVAVTVTVELGRVSLPIGELLQLGEGAVLELDRLVTEPVDVIAQGVLLARGEIVVVNDTYAVRIQEVVPESQPSRTGAPAAAAKLAAGRTAAGQRS